MLSWHLVLPCICLMMAYDYVMENWTHAFIKTNGITLHVVQAGPHDGPLLIFLHGFPEYWYGWRHQISFFAQAGYRVWIPDQRGYNLSDKPRGLDAYSLDELAADVVGLIDAAGCECAYLVGHDWGANVAWWVAIHYPERLHKLGILNVPHPVIMRQNLRDNPAQLRKSWYMFFFQVPLLPETMIRAVNWRLGWEALQRSSRPGTFSEADLAASRHAWARPGAFTGMLNWYRAIIQRPPHPHASVHIAVPTLLIWGAQDMFLGQEMAEPSVALCENGRFVIIEAASHWVQHEEPEQVNQLLAAFFAES